MGLLYTSKPKELTPEEKGKLIEKVDATIRKLEGNQELLHEYVSLFNDKTLVEKTNGLRDLTLMRRSMHIDRLTVHLVESGEDKALQFDISRELNSRQTGVCDRTQYGKRANDNYKMDADYGVNDLLNSSVTSDTGGKEFILGFEDFTKIINSLESDMRTKIRNKKVTDKVKSLLETVFSKKVGRESL